MRKWIKSIFLKAKPACKLHVIEEGWFVQQVRFRRCINCAQFETEGWQNGYEKLTKDNCVYFDGDKVER